MDVLSGRWTLHLILDLRVLVDLDRHLHLHLVVSIGHHCLRDVLWQGLILATLVGTIVAKLFIRALFDLVWEDRVDGLAAFHHFQARADLPREFGHFRLGVAFLN